jgi:hypothetical protein
MMPLYILVDVRVAAVRAHAAAVEAWHASGGSDKHTRLRELREAMALDNRTRVDLDDAIARAARGT